jgi:lactate 2-monooxygenase
MKFPALDRQKEIYLNGFAGITPAVPISFSELESAAKKILSPQAYAYIAGGAGNESTVRGNTQSFEKHKIVPRMLRNVSERDTSMELFGQKFPSPILLAPIGVLELAHAQADLAVGKPLRLMFLIFFRTRLHSRWKKLQLRWEIVHVGFNCIGANQMSW